MVVKIFDWVIQLQTPQFILLKSSRFKSSFLFSFFLFIPFVSKAAPHAAMGSSVLSSIKNDLAVSNRGYRLGLAGTGWVFSKTSLTIEKDRFELDVPQLNSASIEILQLNRKISLKNFIQKSNKDYYHFGFEMRGQREVLLPNSRLFLLDLFHRKENKHLRQMVLELAETARSVPSSEDSLPTPANLTSSQGNLAPLSTQKQEPAKAERLIAIMTCKYDPEKKESLKNCNELGSLFSWTSQKADQKNFSLSGPLQQPLSD
jgi:hypothetical protein